jgi:N12 class adenine-specific DNA methylase
VPLRPASPARWWIQDQDGQAPSGTVARARANIAALHTLRQVQTDQRHATPEEQAVLARWGGWGAIPGVFEPDRHPELAWAAAELKDLLSPAELAAAKRNTISSFYTDVGLARAMWSAMTDLGFAGGQVLEPGCGSGNFIGLAPTDADMVGVELDPVSAGIAAQLYPDATILGESFADTAIPDATFDAVIGNVPFGNVVLNDPRHNAGGHSLHNHVILKALHLTKPGGTVAVITSRYTLDAGNPAARREIAELADLVGAIRLPATAHQRAAGTKVVSDVLIFSRREPGRDHADESWLQTRTVRIGDHDVAINAHFLDHPDHVLGELSTRHGAYRDGELTVNTTGDLALSFRAALAGIVATAHREGLEHAPETLPGPRPWEHQPPIVVASSRAPEGHIAAQDHGAFTVVADGHEQLLQVPKSQAEELRALLDLRDTAVELLNTEAMTVDDGPELQQLRDQLNRQYDTFAAKFGPINRFSWRNTGRIDPATGKNKVSRHTPRQGGFRNDPHAPTVYALEVFDPSTQTAAKADVFNQRVVARKPPQLGADSPADALAICLDTHGRIELDVVAQLLGTDPDTARERLGTLVFEVPPSTADVDNALGEAEPGQLVTAAEYLSGNVRHKHTAAVEASATDPRFATNAAALAQAIPLDIPADDIAVQLGAPWIGERDVAAFLADILGDNTIQVQHAGSTNWQVRGYEHGVAATETWGTTRMPAPVLAQTLLQQRGITVFDTVETPDGDRRVVNMEATILAQEKAAALNDRFAEWVWEDPARAERLVRTYNDLFNGIVSRSYDDAELSLPGLALGFNPRPHQVAAVARMIHEPAVGLYHEVGAGKTAEMAMGCMELRRLGMVSKPCLVVPNHMLEQFSREWAQLYPRAKLLSASSDDLAGTKRRAFVARCATGDWDAIVMTRGAFERIPMTTEAEEAYLRREIETLEAQIENIKGRDNPISLKRMQRMLWQAEERIEKKLSARRDPGLTFEATGIDYVVVDEAHGYKNLRTPSNIPGAGIDGSNRASDLDMKLHYLRERYGKRVATFATATPIANSVTEAYVMQRYLRPDLLEAAGVEDFDSWAATFGQSVSSIELSPEGGSFRMKTRFAKFRNVPELLQMWHVSADVKTAEDLNLDTPQLAARGETGIREPETQVVQPGDELVDYMGLLAKRAEEVRNRAVKPEVDNMLKISSDGRAAALAVQLVDLEPSSEETKLDLAARQIARYYHDNAQRQYSGSERRGAFQLVFCDLGTPKKDGQWNAYDELRDKAAKLGVPAAEFRFVHEANNDQQKAELFAACRDGRVAVLMGSTERMGVGTNVQKRALALHHLDCPWRPADLAQRDGRIIRQGNENDEVYVVRYVTEGSFDGYSWQTVTRKAGFIAQIMRGRLDVREIEDIGDAALSYNEVKALATGNPLLLDHANASAEVTKLERLQRAHDKVQDRLPKQIEKLRTQVQQDVTQLEHIDKALGQRQPTGGDKFAMTVGTMRFTDRVEAQAALVQKLHQVAAGARISNPDEALREEHIATLAGVEITAVTTYDPWKGRPEIRMQPAGVFRDSVKIGGTTAVLRELENGHGTVLRLENVLGRLESTRENTAETIDRGTTEISRSEEELAKPFAKAEELAEAKVRLAGIEHEMAEQAKPEQEEPNPDEAAAEVVSDAVRLLRASSPVSTREAVQQEGDASKECERDERAHLSRTVEHEINSPTR